MIFCNGINSPAPLCMQFHTCNYVFTSGKNKNNTCNKDGYFEGDGCYCVVHHKTMLNKQSVPSNLIGSNTNTQTCTVVLKTGKRNGQPCGAKCMDGSYSYCKRHGKVIPPIPVESSS